MSSVGRVLANFLSWDIGYVERWSVTLENQERSEEGGAGASLRRWVAIEDGPQLKVRWGRHVCVVRFGSPRDLRAAREWLRGGHESMLARIDAVVAPGIERPGELAFMRTIMPVTLEQAPVIVMDQGSVRTADPSDGVEELPEALLVSGSGDQFIVVATPYFGESDPQVVALFTSNGEKLACRREPAPGGEVLRVIEKSKVNTVARVARLVRVPGAPVVAGSSAQVRGTDVWRLATPPNELIESWLDLEIIAKDVDEDTARVRYANPLEYDEVLPGGGGAAGYTVAVRTAEEALRWLPKRPQREGDGAYRMDASVRIVSLEERDETLGRVELLRDTRGQDGRVQVRIVLDREDLVPFPRGRILSAPNAGDEAQRERKRKALQRLIQGEAALPEMLQYLLRPDVIPRLSPAKHLVPHPAQVVSHGDGANAVKAALGFPPLLIIHGPPGTGKTAVIVEILQQIRRRFGIADGGDEGDRRKRVLISSYQNEAVENAVQRLRSGQVYVRHIQRQSDREGDDNHRQERELAAEIVEALKTRLNSVSMFAEIREAQKARAELASLRRAAATACSVAEIREALESAFSLGCRCVLEARWPTLCAEADDMVRTASACAAAAGSTIPHAGKSAGAAAAYLAGLAPSLASATEPDRILLSDPSFEVPDEALEDPDASVGLLGLLDGLKLLRRAASLRRGSGEWPADLRARADALVAGIRSVASSEERVSAGGDCGLGALRDRVVKWAGDAVQLLDDRIAALRDTDEADLAEWLGAVEHRPGDIAKLLARHTPIVGATCQKSDVALEADWRREPFDLVIIDEAGRAGLDILIPMTLGRSVVLIGDHLQLSPYVDQIVQNEYARRVGRDTSRLSESLFSVMRAAAPHCAVQLKTQYRMHPEIGQLVSAVIYEPHGVTLRHASRPEDRRPNLGLLGDTPFVWVDTADRARRAANTLEREGPINDVEVRLVRELLLEAGERLREKGRDTSAGKAIAVLTGYREQRSALQEMLDGLPAPVREVVALHTFDAAQGLEFPVVVLSMVRSNARRDAGFLRFDNRVNVALSRAQRQVILIGDSRTLCAARPEGPKPPLARLYGLLEDSSWPGRIVDSAEVPCA